MLAPDADVIDQQSVSSRTSNDSCWAREVVDSMSTESKTETETSSESGAESRAESPKRKQHWSSYGDSRDVPNQTLQDAKNVQMPVERPHSVSVALAVPSTYDALQRAVGLNSPRNAPGSHNTAQRDMSRASSAW